MLKRCVMFYSAIGSDRVPNRTLLTSCLFEYNEQYASLNVH